jgi:predicted MFS family arabinose efflux permease
VALCYGIVRTDVKGWQSAETLGAMALGVVLLGLFLFIEGRLSARPLVPLRVFRSRTLSGANIVVFFLGASMFAMWYFVSLYLQQVLGYTPIEAGLAFLPMPLAIMAGSTVAARSVIKVGAGKLLTLGMSMSAIGMLLYARLPVNGTYFADVLGPSLLIALGMGLSFVPVTIAAVTGVRLQEQGLASGLVNTSRQVGGSMGLAILATVATARTHALGGGPAAVVAGFHRAFELDAGFAALGAVAGAALLWRVRRPVPQQAAAAADAA